MRLTIAAIVFAVGLWVPGSVHGQDTPAGGRAPAAPGATDETPPAPVEVEEARDDRGRRVLNFTGLDIEGRVHGPQLLHFRRRLRSAVRPRRLPHRSFIPELLRSAHGRRAR